VGLGAAEAHVSRFAITTASARRVADSYTRVILP
jgi:hypothetical protein